VPLNQSPQMLEDLSVDLFARDVTQEAGIIHDVERLLAETDHFDRPVLLIHNQAAKERFARHRHLPYDLARRGRF
jgi:hypothetical protein